MILSEKPNPIRLAILLLLLAGAVVLLWLSHFSFGGDSPYVYIETSTVSEIEAIEQDTNEENDSQAVTPEPDPLPPGCVLLENFSGESPLRWGTVNDGVMGGRSDGVASITDGVLTHEGTLNTNGGGFSYVGTRLPEDALIGYTALELRLNTNGRQYAINFSDSRYRSISHFVRIPLAADEGWQEVRVDFADTVPTFFGRRTNSEPFAASAINELNFILSDGIDGSFEMELDWVRLCQTEEPATS
jgi:hypothetical protein